MQLQITQIANRLGAKTIGDENVVVSYFRAIDEACHESISPLLRRGMIAKLTTLPAAVLTEEGLVKKALDAGVRAAIVHPRPQLAMAELIDIFYPIPKQPVGIHPTAFVDESAQVHPTAWIGPCAIIESQTKIGEGSVIGPSTVICSGCEIGRFVKLGPAVVIGAQGFGFVPTEAAPLKIRQVGKVIIEDFVEIGANSCIDRGTLGSTIIGAHSKLDNLVQVGHNAKIGKHVLISGQTGLAGSTVVGDNAMLGGQTGVADHVTIGAHAKIAGRSGVTQSVPEGATMMGFPAMPRSQWLRMTAGLHRKTSGNKREQ